GFRLAHIIARAAGIDKERLVFIVPGKEPARVEAASVPPPDRPPPIENTGEIRVITVSSKDCVQTSPLIP
ncbi:MAG: hypothetical protein JXA42_03385, partial [Anaerolineales bacterium]|nr:hypothetical protein [Anaerolineales bacterium]